MDAVERLTGAAQMKEQILYTVFYIIAAVFMLIMGVPGFVSGLLIIGAALYNVSKVGKSRYWFEENSSAETGLAIFYLIVVGAGVILAMLYLFRVLE
jgi:hypothetical protein